MNVVVHFLHSFIRSVQLTTSTQCQATQRHLLPHTTTSGRLSTTPPPIDDVYYHRLHPRHAIQTTTWKVTPPLS